MEDIPALDLFRGENTLSEPKEITFEDLQNGFQLDESVSSGTVLDAKSLKNFRDRIKEINKALTELNEVLEEAKTLETSDKKEEIEQKIYDFQKEKTEIEQQIKNNTTRDGKLKKFANQNEQTRSKVAHAVKTAIKNIDQHDPALADHLTNKIKIGVKCHYQDSINWNA